MEEPEQQRHFRQMLKHFEGAIDHIVFATDYPHWDADDPDDAFPVALAPDLEQKIYFDNAARLYRLT
jgi:predicted TIM-barrel fold metal-dependent hydrolase